MIRITVLTVLAVALAAAPAGAATVTWTPPYMDPPGTDPESSCSRYQQCPPASLAVADTKNERNDITVERSGGEIVVRDGAAPLEAGSGCRQEADGSVRCPDAPGVSVEAGGGDDRVRAPGSVAGGDGDDDLVGTTAVSGGPGRDVVRGDDSSNLLRGGPGADRVEGNGGDDIVTDDDGESLEKDFLDGGAGIDTISFEGRVAGVVVDLGATPQTGASAGEENVIAGFENVSGGEGDDELLGVLGTFPARLLMSGGGGRDRIVAQAVGTEFGIDGGAGDDEITGGDADDTIHGGAGDDSIDGAAGVDDIVAQEGSDRATGGEGDDLITGGSGRDELLGGPGDDRVDGNRGRDRLRGGSGADRVSARDGKADDVDCGPGRDRARADRRERARRCETVKRPKRRR